ncbi:uncharacterized protein LOC117642521 [Thrips palmi]|uniref:Uncharacterized protein LOC117642521 n=1 Tax=Thrips palmi TaxID=161013 RepID=A0A6P8YRG9_THRPL|nr:uncharacterized protein LOC117642521 [Thrips palmi]
MTEEVDDEMDVSFGDEEFGIANSTFNSVAPVDDSFESSFEGDIDDPTTCMSTPVKDKEKGKGGRFKVPKPPPAKYFKKCGSCGRYILTERGWKTHEQTHRWKDAAALKPSVQELIEISREKAPQLIEQVISEFNASEGEPGFQLALEIRSVLGDLKQNIHGSAFLTIVLSLIQEVLSSKARSKAMPSALRPVLQTELSKIYSDSDKRKKLMDTFLEVTTTKESIAWNIIFIFIKKVMDSTFITMCAKIRGSDLLSTKHLSKDDFNHHLSQQLVHHVSGSCLRAHFRNAYTYPKNRYMRNVRDCILEKFGQIGHPSVMDKKSPKYWTSLLNKKSLFFLHESALPFFIELSKILQSLETRQGTPLHKDVMEVVVSNAAMTTLWDATVGNSLSDEESFRFMTQVIKSLGNRFGKGVMLRRMNAKAKTGKANKTSLAPGFRARLIGKQ